MIRNIIYVFCVIGCHGKEFEYLIDNKTFAQDWEPPNETLNCTVYKICPLFSQLVSSCVYTIILFLQDLAVKLDAIN